MTRNSDEFVDQTRLAAALKVTTRRVRQMVDEHILPPAHHETGLYDLALCEERYALYRDGSDRDWDRFFDDAERGTVETKDIYEKAFVDGATIADVTAASRAVQDDMGRMHFLTACKGKSAAQRELFHTIWQREEDSALRSLLGRLMVLSGATEMVDETGEVIARLLVPAPPVQPTTPKRRRKVTAD
jgi:hypothetical protein